MEKPEKNKRKKRKKIPESPSFSVALVNADTIFPLLLATLCNSQPPPTSQSLTKKCLNKLKMNDPLPNSILSLLPTLLTSRYPDIACRSAEVLGAASLLSVEMNERIALDCVIVKALLFCLGSCKKNVSVSACNALLDLSTTSIGRCRLFEFSALERVIICFLQVPKSSILISLCTDGRKNVANIRIVFKEDRHMVSLLSAAISLINTCNLEQLSNIPRSLCASFLEFLKNLWKEVRTQMLHGNILISISETSLCTSNFTVNNLAESIFRLSTNTDQFAPLPSVLVESRIFGSSKCSFETFMLCHWEASPFLVRRSPTSLVEVNEIFSPFTESLTHTQSPYTFFSPMLQNFISCLPIASDELDILNFLEEVRNELGCPVVYHQDIRVLRTDKQSKKEVHFFPKNSETCQSKNPHGLTHSDILKCEEAFKQGYTIALRGMEFRFASIAALADTLACLFGQPSVGANLYITPPNSQGLACHYDDHCVFVCQLFGNKQWRVFSESKLQLPRLYDPIENQANFDSESSLADHTKYHLREGDVLYIPRGFAHEACTDDMKSSELAKFSLHITFGIEVEPPFEWTGFAHVALHHWNQTRKQSPHAMVEPFSGSLNAIILYLLDTLIELIGASDPTFRKACLVCALSSSSDRKDWLFSKQKTTFHYLIDKINTESRFSEVLSIMEMAIEKKDLRQRMSWIQLLNKQNEATGEHDLYTTSVEVEKLLPVFVQQQDRVKAAFMQMKTKFCAEVLFDDVIGSYIMLFEKYKKARKQYLNGMLSLHCC
ncbi:uncharacterized protein LOC126669577 [Mercurialis annua]|uniref:uncharacterized protein LOC126669577 n=1 Tax=Mercurialis annua TaxID=3986 RepID=UPI00215F0886|nr:uncharacterized protein LOC126669577 [Mercurialis annua]